MGECKYMAGKACNFEHELTKEDCIICMPCTIMFHTNMLLNSVCEMDVKFGHAKNIYVAFEEVRIAQRGLVKLMTVEYPETLKRSTVQLHEPPKFPVVV